MKCVIPGLNIKVFARAIHSLARVGDELYVEPSNSGVYFRTVNSSRSAFSSFYFKPGFFSLFDFKVYDAQQQNNFKCKVAMKACLNAFKSVNNIERSVEKCRLVIDPDADQLVVSMTCRHGINKTYNLSFIECETLQAVFDKSSCSFRITSQSRVLCDAFVNFQSNQEEVTLSASKEKIVIRNYVDDDPDPAKSIHTELTLEADEFDSYDVDRNCEVTFCLKELRSLLSFSEPVNLPIFIVFTAPGLPIIFCVENPASFETDFVLATLSTNLNSTQSQSSVKTKHLQRQSNATFSQNSSSRREQQCTSMKRPSETIEESLRLQNHSRHSIERVADDSGSKLDVHKKESMDYTRASSRLNQVNNITNTPPALSETRIPFEKRPPLLPKTSLEIGEKRMNGLVEDGDESMVPGTPPDTPPAKRRKFFFQRCFEPTFNADNLSGFNRILAEDSDED